MKKLFFLLVAGLFAAAPLFAQKYMSRDAKVEFSSDTPIEKIYAVNKSGATVLDTKTGRMEWKVLIKNFNFQQALMQEHFNENYLESDKYPNSTFKGELVNLNAINFSKDGVYNAQAKGKLTMHGVEREVTIPGTVTVSGGKLNLKSTFNVACADYKIDIPSVVRDKIAKEIKVMVNADLTPLSK